MGEMLDEILFDVENNVKPTAGAVITCLSGMYLVDTVLDYYHTKEAVLTAYLNKAEEVTPETVSAGLQFVESYMANQPVDFYTYVSIPVFLIGASVLASCITDPKKRKT